MILFHVLNLFVIFLYLLYISVSSLQIVVNRLSDISFIFLWYCGWKFWAMVTVFLVGACVVYQISIVDLSQNLMNSRFLYVFFATCISSVSACWNDLPARARPFWLMAVLMHKGKLIGWVEMWRRNLQACLRLRAHFSSLCRYWFLCMFL